MTTFSDMLFQLGGMPALAGVPFGPKSKYYFVDPVNGLDANNGTSDKPKKTLAAAEDLCIANQNDVVFFIAGASNTVETASITWDKDYTHLIGIGCDLLGLGQRCRVITAVGIAATTVMTISASGCIFRNIQFNNEYATGAVGIVNVTGSRNSFENCFFMSPAATTAASYSLKLSGSECAFVRSTIGQLTNPRTAATYGLWLYGAATCLRNKFIQCEFLSWSSVTTHKLVYVDAAVAVVPWTIWFENCLFHNQPNGAASGTLAVAINDNSTAAEHMIIKRGRDSLVVGCTAVADPLTYVFAPDADDAVSGLLAIAVVES